MSYNRLLTELRELALLTSTSSLIQWDEQTMMPRAAGDHRAAQTALLARLCHDKFTSPAVGDLIAEAEAATDSSDFYSDENATLRDVRRQYNRAVKVPTALVEELTHVTMLAQQVWQDARQNRDGTTFLPILDKILKLKRQEAACLQGEGDSLYDALLDEYEPVARTSDIVDMFTAIKGPLTRLVHMADPTRALVARELMTRSYPIPQQVELGRYVAEAVGFDFTAGRIDVSTHPFCSFVGPGDTRMTTRYDARDFANSFFSVLHETGHGLYDQGLPPENFGLPLGDFVSLGIHESQSRLWENLVGRSAPFWEWLLPKVRELFPEALSDVSDDEWLSGVNSVSPTLIRTESDEVTYNLHILLRFELELALINGDLNVGDLPSAWNQRTTELLGITPAHDSEGYLQDIHWSGGAFGYFPTYTLGNINASQLFHACQQQNPALTADIAQGDFTTLLGWLRSNIHQQGRRYNATEVIERATGLRPTPEALLHHLATKVQTYCAR